MFLSNNYTQQKVGCVWTGTGLSVRTSTLYLSRPKVTRVNFLSKQLPNYKEKNDKQLIRQVKEMGTFHGTRMAKHVILVMLALGFITVASSEAGK